MANTPLQLVVAAAAAEEGRGREGAVVVGGVVQPPLGAQPIEAAIHAAAGR
jgi:hypothetical protein